MDAISLNHWYLSRSHRILFSKLTLWSAEMYGLRHGAHALRVSGLDLEVVGGIQRQLLDLVGQAVAHHWFNYPVVDLSVYICAVVDDITYNREGQKERNKFSDFNAVQKKINYNVFVLLGFILPSQTAQSESSITAFIRFIEFKGLHLLLVKTFKPECSDQEEMESPLLTLLHKKTGKCQ